MQDIMQMATEGKANELRETLRLRALTSLYFFAKAIMGYKELSALHLEFCAHVQQTRAIRKRGYLLPRGHFKSTIMKSYALWRLLPTQPHDPPELREVHDPNTRILFVGESDTVGAKNLRDIQHALTHNQVIEMLFPEIFVRDVKSTKWTTSEILVPRSRSFDESSITTIGIGAKHTGFHYDLIIYDDVIGDKAAKSEAEMSAAWEWFQFAPGFANDPSDFEEVLIGTRWKHGAADLYGKIQKELAHGSTESGRPTGFTWYTRSAIEDNQPIFPERFTIETLDEIRKREGEYKFSCQYLNMPSTPEGADFPEKWLKQYYIGQDNQTLVPEDGTKPVKLLHLLRMSMYDPSAGGRSAGCETAIMIAGMSADRRIFVIDVWSRNCGFGTAIEQWHILNDRFQCYRNHYEMVGAQKAVEEILEERKQQQICRFCGKQHKKITPVPVKPDGRIKEDRIRNYAQDAMENGRVYLRRGMAELRRQIISFPHGDLVDQFDVLAYLIKLLRPPLAEEEVETMRIEESKRKDALSNASRIETEHNYGGYA